MMKSSFRTTNCYGLSNYDLKKIYETTLFPYNELLWFILSQISYGTLSSVSVQRIVMVYRKGKTLDSA